MAIPIAAAARRRRCRKRRGKYRGQEFALDYWPVGGGCPVFWLKPLVRRLAGLVPDDAPYFVGGGDVLASFARSGRNRANRLHGGLKKAMPGSAKRISVPPCRKP